MATQQQIEQARRDRHGKLAVRVPALRILLKVAEDTDDHSAAMFLRNEINSIEYWSAA